jgi:hypothetical protein
MPNPNLAELGKPYRFKAGNTISVKGGKTKSPKRAMAQRIRYIKEFGIKTDKDAERLVKILESPEASIMDMHRYLMEIRDAVETPQEKAIVLTHMQNLHKLHHGEKKSLDIRSLSVNVNIDKEIEDIDKYLVEVIGEDDE